MATKPATPARPAPTAAFACEAAPVDWGAAGEPVAEWCADETATGRVAEWTAETEVLFAPVVGSALTTELMTELTAEVTAEVTAADADETTGVVVASAVAGYSKGRMLLTSAGIEAYQPGGLPAASAELISAAKAEGDAMAELRASLGSAVASTIRTDCDCSGLHHRC
jgi:hypothetical protein